MIPIGDENIVLRPPLMTVGLLVLLALVWLVVQGAGDPLSVAASVCNYGLVPGEITRLADPGLAVPIGPGLACVVDREPINYATPVTSMFLHAGWAHVLGNGLFLWVFGKSVEDSMERAAFLGFYLITGLAGAALQVAVNPDSPVPMVGASGAISGVMGGYLVLYPRVHVHILSFWFVFRVPAVLVLLWWVGFQLLAGIPDLMEVKREASGGVAVWAHIGGFVAGALLVKLFSSPRRIGERSRVGRRMRDAW